VLEVNEELLAREAGSSQGGVSPVLLSVHDGEQLGHDWVPLEGDVAGHHGIVASRAHAVTFVHGVRTVQRTRAGYPEATRPMMFRTTWTVDASREPLASAARWEALGAAL
jgi:hypothetical protein